MTSTKQTGLRWMAALLVTAFMSGCADSTPTPASNVSSAPGGNAPVSSPPGATSGQAPAVASASASVPRPQGVTPSSGAGTGVGADRSATVSPGNGGKVGTDPGGSLGTGPGQTQPAATTASTNRSTVAGNPAGGPGNVGTGPNPAGGPVVTAPGGSNSGRPATLSTAPAQGVPGAPGSNLNPGGDSANRSVATSGLTGLPAYPGAFPLPLTNGFERQLSQALAQGLANPQLVAFSTQDNPSRVVDFYTQQLLNPSATPANLTPAATPVPAAPVGGIVGLSATYRCNLVSNLATGPGAGNTGNLRNCAVVSVAPVVLQNLFTSNAPAGVSATALPAQATLAPSGQAAGAAVNSGAAGGLVTLRVVAVGPLDNNTAGLLVRQAPELAAGARVGYSLVMLITSGVSNS